MSHICSVLIHCEIKRAESLRNEILLSLTSTAIMTQASRCFRKTIINTFLTILKRTFKFKNNRYITKLPIRKTDEILPDNYILANNQIINLEKQLDRNKKRFVDYDKIIQECVAAMFFDPLGLISPITLQPKLMLQ